MTERITTLSTTYSQEMRRWGDGNWDGIIATKHGYVYVYCDLGHNISHFTYINKGRKHEIWRKYTTPRGAAIIAGKWLKDKSW